MNTIPLIQEYAKIIYQLLLIGFIIYKWSDIRTIFCEGNGSNMSSKRVIAIMCAATLCRLCLFVTHDTDKADLNVLGVLAIVTVLASAIATMPQILDFVGRIKSVATKETKEEIKKVEVSADIEHGTSSEK